MPIERPLEAPPEPKAKEMIADLQSPELARYWLSAIIESADDAIISKSLEGIIMSWNKGAERIFGYTADEVIGRPVTILIPDDQPDEEPSILARLRAGERIEHYETIRIRKDGQPVNISLTVSPIRDSTGKIIGASKIARDITERRRVEAERDQLLERERQARQEAEEAGRLKDEFLATISHELRTPLTSILGWANLLRSHQLDEKSTSTALETIESNARFQSQLIDDLLDVSRIVVGKLRLDVRQTTPNSFIEAAVESLMPAAEAKGVRVQKVIDGGLSTVSGDPQRLQQIVWNLLSNAIKFTPHGGLIQVKLERVDSHIEIAVTDTGVGIKREFLPFVFDRFRQADQSTSRKYGGLGLGLAIVRHLVELHGGTVRADSPGDGQGATFTVSLPSLTVPQDENTTQPERTRNRGILNALNFPERLDDLKVLVVEDEPDTRELLKIGLRQCGAEVMVAESAAEALKIMKSFVPSLLISDIGMPEHDGYELIREVRNLPAEAGGKVPAIALTAYARTEDRLHALRAGYQMHVPKPVEIAELIAVASSLVQRGN